MVTHDNVATARAEERGVALVFALFLMIMVGGICVTGSLYLKSHLQHNRTTWATRTQALQAARSGLAEGHNWLRRQTSQPVLVFAPQLDTSVTPNILDTIDEDIGLVREFRVTDRIWARYEVWRQWNTDPDPARLVWRRQFQCEDVSTKRGANSTGAIWRLTSIGYIYNRFDPAVPFDEAPNAVIASQVASNEYRRVVIKLPGNGAINVNDGNNAHINTNGRVIGGTGAGIYYPASTGTPTVGPLSANRVTGSPGLSPASSPPLPPYDDSYEAVFGMSYEQLRAMASVVVTNMASFPSPLPPNGIVIIDAGPSVNIGPPKPLLGNAIVIVKGHLTMNDGNNANFNGLLYCEGNMTMRAPSLIRGSVICKGNLTLQGVGDFATVQYDADVLNALLANVGNYTASNSPLLPRIAR